MRAQILVLTLVCLSSAVNLRTQQEGDALLETDSLGAGCVQVFEKCGYKGASVTSCNGQLEEFDYEVASVKTTKGWGISFFYPGGQLHVFGTLSCLGTPINQKCGEMKIQATHMDDFEYKDYIKL